jgi:hypothetical protein
MNSKLLACGLLALAGAGVARAGWLWGDRHDTVAVSSTAVDAYTRQKFGASATKPESYLFFQGKFYAGTIRDPDLEHAQFNSIVQVLGQDLAKQNYFPSTNLKDADLLIVVHWGTTEVYQADFADSFVLPKAPYLPGIDPRPNPHDSNIQMVSVDLYDQLKNYYRNLHLLGYGQQLSEEQAKKHAEPNPDERTLFQSMNRERYFVILMAYDYRTMKKGVRPRLLWSTRFSIASAGNSFTAALPLMSRAAADYFGHSEGIKSVNPHKPPTGTVTLGPLDVIGEVPEGEKTGAPAPPPKRK